MNTDQVKHSPGPWSLEVIDGRPRKIVDADGEFVTFVAATLANAHLMKAAPMLLAALVELAGVDGDEHYARAGSLDDPCPCALCAAHAAIAMVEGRHE